jgi:hypothetical protein
MVPKNNTIFYFFLKIFSIKWNVTMIFVISVKNCINWCINQAVSTQKQFFEIFWLGYPPGFFFKKIFFHEKDINNMCTDLVFDGDHEFNIIFVGKNNEKSKNFKIWARFEYENFYKFYNVQCLATKGQLIAIAIPEKIISNIHVYICLTKRH